MRTSFWISQLNCGRSLGLKHKTFVEWAYTSKLRADAMKQHYSVNRIDNACNKSTFLCFIFAVFQKFVMNFPFDFVRRACVHQTEAVVLFIDICTDVVKHNRIFSCVICIIQLTTVNIFEALSPANSKESYKTLG